MIPAAGRSARDYERLLPRSFARNCVEPAGTEHHSASRDSTRADLRCSTTFPLPNTFGGSGGSAFNYVAQSPLDVPKRSKVIRFDVKPSNNDTDLLEVSVVDF